MEQSNSIFSLSIDPITKNHLSDTAKWARLIAIIGMISLALMIGFGVYASTLMASNLTGQYEQEYGTEGDKVMQGVGVGMAIAYIIIAIICFFPLLFLLRFANQMRTALTANDQESLNTAFQQLKICFRYTAIISIIALILYALGFLVTVFGSGPTT